MTPCTHYYGPQQQQLDEVPFSEDKHFALHGEIVLLVLVTVFFLFIVFILMIPRLKKRATRSHESETEGDSNIIAGHNNPWS